MDLSCVGEHVAVRAESVKGEGCAIFDSNAAEEELVLLGRAHIFEEGKALRVLLAPFSTASTMHEATQSCNAVRQLACT